MLQASRIPDPGDRWHTAFFTWFLNDFNILDILLSAKNNEQEEKDGER